VRWQRLGLGALVTVAILAAVGCADEAGRPDARPTRAKLPPTERCDGAVQPELDPGLESRTIVAGPVALVPSRVSPVPEGASPARNFKLAVRLDPRADATLRTRTAGTTLLFDRDALHRDNIYRLGDGTKSVRFTGCPDRSAVFVGVVLTTGPTTVDVDVRAKGHRSRVTLTAFTGLNG
jgi:hypothetical protein